MENIYDQDRISKISKIMPQFNKVARVGDSVLMGLEGDPCFPNMKGGRPSATIENIVRGSSGTQIDLRMSDGSTKSVNEFSIVPNEVWEYSDASFTKVMEREREANERRMVAARAEESVKAHSTTKYRGEGDIRSEIEQLRSELKAEIAHTRNFHSTYIASLHELAADVCKLDSTGKCANFCRTFNTEYTKMQSRAESSAYRGKYDGEDGFEDKEEDLSQNQQAEFYTESEQESCSENEADMAMNESDYF